MVHKLVSLEVVGGKVALVRRAWWVGSSEWLGDGMRVPIGRHVRNGNMTSQKWMTDGIRVESERVLDFIIAEGAQESWLGRRSPRETPKAAFVQLIRNVKTRMSRCAWLAVEILFQNVAHNAINLTA